MGVYKVIVIMSREVGPVVRFWRNWVLSGRAYNQALRFETDQSARSIPTPTLPPGVSHKLSDNTYSLRDGRRAVAPPKVVYSYAMKEKALEPGTTGEPEVKEKKKKRSKLRTPGTAYQWEEVV